MSSKPWADSPWPLLETPSKTQDVKSHASVYIADDMAQVHNVLLRGLNAIYHQAPYISTPTDITDFLFFIHCYCSLVELRHSAEEDFLFPAISELADNADLLAPSTAQHETFAPGVHELHQYAKNSKISSSPATAYSGTHIQSLISSFAPSLRSHLADEIDALLKLRHLDSAALMQIHRDAEKAKAPPKPEMFPLFFGLVDVGYEGGIHRSWPEVPFFVPWIVRFWFSRRHCGAWRFLPCDFWGRRKELEFVE